MLDAFGERLPTRVSEVVNGRRHAAWEFLNVEAPVSKKTSTKKAGSKKTSAKKAAKTPTKKEKKTAA